MKIGKEAFHRVRGCRSGNDRHAVKLAAIAGGKHDGFFENSAAAQLVGRIQRLLLCESDAFAKLDRSGAMTTPDQGNVHFRIGDGWHGRVTVSPAKRTCEAG
jgi:hypothetical protein